MNYIFVFSIGIFIGNLLAFEIFQKQLEKIIFREQVCDYVIKYGWLYDGEEE